MFAKWRDRVSALGFRQVRRVVIFVVGMTVLMLGVALLVLPGPAVLVIPAGLAILGLEFRWARRWMRRARAVIRSGETRFFRRGTSKRKAAQSAFNRTSLRPALAEPEFRIGRGDGTPSLASGVGRIDTPILDEGEEEKSGAKQQQPKATFGDGDDHTQADQEGKKQVHADCSH
jgi:uncharacterized protein (TIGR02611 family)